MTLLRKHADSLQALHKIKSSDLAFVTGASMISELEGVISMVASLAEGVGLSALEIKNFRTFIRV
jgi:hypothetical protein